jgi:hypothetical protein
MRNIILAHVYQMCERWVSWRFGGVGIEPGEVEIEEVG